MAEKGKTTVRISQAAARYLRPGAEREIRLQAARGEAGLPAGEAPVVQFCLTRDADPEIRAAAMDGLRGLSEQVLLELAGSTETHPRLLELLARLHGRNQAVGRMIALNPAADAAVLANLPGDAPPPAGEQPEEPEQRPIPVPAATPLSGNMDEGEEPEEEQDEVFQNTYRLAKEMTVAEKIKMALTGDKEWRMLLVKDINKLVSGSVVKNPRITEPEVLLISKSHLNNDDILRDICNNKDWIKNYQIKKALVENHKTPLHFALRFLSGLSDKDLAVLAKSKNISSVISTQARRLMMNKQKDK